MNTTISPEKKKSRQKDWEWMRLGEACDFVGGGTPSKKNSDYWGGKINWASVKDIKGEYLNTTVSL
jgi:type I restriction enzyme S subunit